MSLLDRCKVDAWTPGRLDAWTPGRLDATTKRILTNCLLLLEFLQILLLESPDLGG
uniref:hypothetical protein n=1 Tax=Pseudomonas sp. TaxID=306 RepID=UPI00159EC4FC|nr:hypothetical protein [Pseudomonas sp.]